MRKTLEKQGYHFVGPHKHSAVKTCLWLWKAMRREGEGNCYKGKFYGIAAHRCVQMTPSIFCNQRCVHCWRPLEAFNIRKEEEVVWDSPEEIVDGCLKEQQRLISGFKGSHKTDKNTFAEAQTPKHAAISLIGEPTLYPQLAELVQEFHSRGMTTFVVTNGTNPEVVRKISPSQLYLSLNAPNEEIYKKVAHPDYNYWSRVKESLEELGRKGKEKEREKREEGEEEEEGEVKEEVKEGEEGEEGEEEGKRRTRTVVRITCVEGLNIQNPEGYAELLKIAKPDFVEVKAFMHIGYSRRRLPREAMPSHSRVKAFASEIAEQLGSGSGADYKVVNESEVSRVVLVSKK